MAAEIVSRVDRRNSGFVTKSETCMVHRHVGRREGCSKKDPKNARRWSRCGKGIGRRSFTKRPATFRYPHQKFSAHRRIRVAGIRATETEFPANSADARL